MKMELQEYADNYAAEILAYETLSTDEFIKKYIDSNYS